jgi:hypothetical protein
LNVIGRKNRMLEKTAYVSPKIIGFIISRGMRWAYSRHGRKKFRPLSRYGSG